MCILAAWELRTCTEFTSYAVKSVYTHIIQTAYIVIKMYSKIHD